MIADKHHLPHSSHSTPPEAEGEFSPGLESCPPSPSLSNVFVLMLGALDEETGFTGSLVGSSGKKEEPFLILFWIKLEKPGLQRLFPSSQSPL